MSFGPSKLGDGRWRFRLWAPAKDVVELEIEGEAPLPMRRGADGGCEAEAACEVGAR